MQRIGRIVTRSNQLLEIFEGLLEKHQAAIDLPMRHSRRGISLTCRGAFAPSKQVGKSLFILFLLAIFINWLHVFPFYQLNFESRLENVPFN